MCKECEGRKFFELFWGKWDFLGVFFSVGVHKSSGAACAGLVIEGVILHWI